MPSWQGRNKLRLFTDSCHLFLKSRYAGTYRHGRERCINMDLFCSSKSVQRSMYHLPQALLVLQSRMCSSSTTQLPLSFLLSFIQKEKANWFWFTESKRSCISNGLSFREQGPQPSPHNASEEAAAGSPASHGDRFQTSDQTKELMLLREALTEQTKSFVSMVKCLQQNK